MNELEKLKEHKHLFFNGDLWWTTEDVDGYNYLQISHAKQLDIILPFIKGNDVVVQAGGHCGYVIRYLKKHFKTIYTFEPDHTMFLALCMNIPDENVIKIQACLGNEHKLVHLEENETCKTAGARYVGDTGIIPMFKIDDLNLNKCDLIMIDTEGYEYNILQGALKTIEKFHPLLCIERFWGPAHYNIPETQMDSFLESIGYIHVAASQESDQVYKYKE